MPDLPELYGTLNSATDYLLRIASEKNPNVVSLSTQSQFVSALCAAIEVKQTQELHEYMNRDDETVTFWENFYKWCEENPGGPYEEKTTTTETDELP